MIALDEPVHLMATRMGDKFILRYVCPQTGYSVTAMSKTGTPKYVVCPRCGLAHNVARDV